MTFAIDLAPAATEHSITFGVVLKYEVYSVAVRVLRIAPVAIPSHLDEHFVRTSQLRAQSTKPQLSLNSIGQFTVQDLMSFVQPPMVLTWC
jgi:hypothetical protein